MKVLVVSNMYPGRNKDFKYAGIFVKEQVDALNGEKDIECDLFIIDGYKSKLHYLFGTLKLYIHLLFNRYDIIHAHYGLSAMFVLFNPFKRKWNNVVLTLHGGDILSAQGKKIQVMLTKMILPKVGAVLTLNEEMNRVVKNYRKDYVICPCGVDASFFCKEDNSERINTVVFPGRKDRKVKNYPLFEEIIQCYEDKYEPLSIIVLDGYKRDEVKKILIESSVMLMTSISEGSPQAIKEAMSCDMAILSTNVGDVSVLLEGVSGADIFEKGECPKLIADKLNKVIIAAKKHSGERRKKLKMLGLDNRQIVKRLKLIYEKAVNNEK
ncbi:glycosyltransferase [Pseudoalteromonas sp. R86517]|uniref:glycosyltransferase n=1 Tax=Pseudoalteromonas sp. R86517 TaxID=3093857 RepID=UPI003671D5AD